MSELAVKVTSVRWLRPALVTLVLVALAGAVVKWGGLPLPDKLPFLILGVVALLLAVALLGVAAWRLLFRPLPPGVADTPALGVPPGIRRALSALIAISGLNIVVGGFWDELWRREYNVSYGSAALWRPQLLMVAGFGLVILMAVGAAWYLARNAQGTVQQRFRAHPTLGLLILAGAFLGYALAAEPLWRVAYGASISGWSMLNLTRGLSFVLVMLLAIALQLSTRPGKRWNTIATTRWAELFVILLSAFMLLVTLQITTTEWDAGSVAVVDHRPAWLLPAVLLLFGSLAGNLTLRTTRLVGSATLTGLLALGIRYGLMRLFNYHPISADPWIVLLPALLALDVWYFLELIDVRKAPRFTATGLTATAGMIVGGFPLINRLFVYPEITINNFPLMAVAACAGALAGAWLGTRVGDHLAEEHKQLAGLNHIKSSVQAIPAGGLVVVVGLIAALILTATPPA